MRLSSRISRLEGLLPGRPCPLDGGPFRFVVKSEQEHRVAMERIRELRATCTCGKRHHFRLILLHLPREAR
jgi:hypothetical protein